MFTLDHHENSHHKFMFTPKAVIDDEVAGEIIKWCNEFAGAHWWECNCAHCDYGFVNFKEAAPAMLFKMRWC